VRTLEELRDLYLKFKKDPTLVDKYYERVADFQAIIPFHNEYPDSTFLSVDVKGLPESIRDIRDPHPMKLRTFCEGRHGNAYTSCGGCAADVGLNGYRYDCGICAFSLHPTCICDKIPIKFIESSQGRIVKDPLQRFTLSSSTLYPSGEFRYVTNENVDSRPCNICSSSLPRSVGKFEREDSTVVLHPHCFQKAFLASNSKA